MIEPRLLVMVERSAPYGITSCCKLCDRLMSPADSAFQPRVFCQELVTVFTKALLNTSYAPLPHLAAMLLECLQKFGVTELGPQLLTFTFSTSIRDTRCFLTGITCYVTDQPFIDQVLAIGTAMGWETLRPSLLPVFQKHTGLSGDITICCDLMDKLVSTSCPSQLISEQKHVFQDLMQMILDVVRD